jgi:ribosomal RNA assembly protein
MTQLVKIPAERVGVLIGKGGETKDLIEKRSGVKLTIDSEEGDVEIDHTHAIDPSMAIVVGNIVMAIGRGFSPSKALKLLENDCYLQIYDIRDYVGRTVEHVSRMRARVIGTKGRTREIFEEITGADVSVYGNTVAIIGTSLQVEIAGKGMEMLLSGSEHAAVYHFLEGRRAHLKVDGLGF